MSVISKIARVLRPFLKALPGGHRSEEFIVRIYRWLKTRSGLVKHDFYEARSLLLSSPHFSEYEKKLVEKVSLEIHHEDTMYAGDAFHYLSVGISATRCIRKALQSVKRENSFSRILDFPCGYGRVLRFLKEIYPDAEITTVEIDEKALNFCGKTFNSFVIKSDAEISSISLSGKFDLIWCGSLITNIDEKTARDLLCFFCDHLDNGGLCVITTHGQRSIDLIKTGKNSFGLRDEEKKKVVSGFEARGYGYADFPGQSGYGISSVSRERMIEMAKIAGSWYETLFIENGWDENQDLYVFSRLHEKGNNV